jgi:hypothetical protein
MERRFFLVIFVMIFTFSSAWSAMDVKERYPIGHADQGLSHPEFLLTPITRIRIMC